MIGQLRGKLIEKEPPYVLIDVNGVGYLVQSSLSTIFALPELGKEVILRTHMVVREDAQLIYGFASKDECRLFQEIIKVNGVGPKVALAILSGLSPQEFMNLIQNQESSHLQRLPGIGAKIAQRIVLEMQNKLKNLGDISMAVIANPHATTASNVQEATAALVSLGYKPNEASKALSKITDLSQSSEYLIKEALQGLAKV